MQTKPTDIEKLVDRILGRMDRCPCHPTRFDPDNPAHEGRGPGECADCEADNEAIADL